MSIFTILFYIMIIVMIVKAKKGENQPSGQKGNYSAKTTMPISSPKQRRKSNVSQKEESFPNVPRKKQVEKSFMEPHREETKQPKIRTNNLWGEDKYAGQRIVALRLMEGDPVPQGYHMIKCPYCAAENLVTKNCKQHHSCYFCRVPID